MLIVILLIILILIYFSKSSFEETPTNKLIIDLSNVDDIYNISIQDISGNLISSDEITIEGANINPFTINCNNGNNSISVPGFFCQKGFTLTGDFCVKNILNKVNIIYNTPIAVGVRGKVGNSYCLLPAKIDGSVYQANINGRIDEKPLKIN